VRRFNKDRSHKEGYSWLRFQESKPLAFFLFLVVITLPIPLFFEINSNKFAHIAHAIIAISFVRYAFTEIAIYAEEDGVYLEVNKKKTIKISDWDCGDAVFRSERNADDGFIKKESVYLVDSNGDEKKVYECLCNKMHIFFASACADLKETHERKEKRKIN
jgi:hypothetical protein